MAGSAAQGRTGRQRPRARMKQWDEGGWFRGGGQAGHVEELQHGASRPSSGMWSSIEGSLGGESFLSSWQPPQPGTPCPPPSPPGADNPCSPPRPASRTWRGRTCGEQRKCSRSRAARGGSQRWTEEAATAAPHTAPRPAPPSSPPTSRCVHSLVERRAQREAARQVRVRNVVAACGARDRREAGGRGGGGALQAQPPPARWLLAGTGPAACRSSRRQN